MRGIIYFIGFIFILMGGWKLFMMVDRPLPSWQSGEKNYRQAVDEAQTLGKPMLVYFYTNWCPYCKNLNENILKKPAVQKALQPFNLIRVNPDKGAFETKLTREYRVSSYPTLLLESYSGADHHREAVARVDSEEQFVGLVTAYARKHGRVSYPAESSARGEIKTLKLKSGREVSGVLTKTNEKGYWLQTEDMGEVFFGRNEFVEIESA